MSRCHRSRSYDQSCPDLDYQNANRITCIELTLKLHGEQIAGLKTRTEFLLCKLREITDSLGEEVDELQDLATALSEDVSQLQEVTDGLDGCGVLTIGCEASDSGSASFSDSGLAGNMLVSGTMDPDVTGLLLQAGVSDGRDSWSSDGTQDVPESGEFVFLRWISGVNIWQLLYTVDGEFIESWQSSEDVASPDLVVTWTATEGGTGSPVITEV